MQEVVQVHIVKRARTPFAFKYWWDSVYQLGKGEKKQRGKKKKRTGEKKKRGKVEKGKRKIGEKKKRGKEKRRKEE